MQVNACDQKDTAVTKIPQVARWFKTARRHWKDHECNLWYTL